MNVFPFPSHMLFIPLNIKCYCGGGSSAGDFDDLGSGCAAPCGGDTAEFCGGGSVTSIYRITDVSVVGEKNVFNFLTKSTVFISCAPDNCLQIDPDRKRMYVDVRKLKWWEILRRRQASYRSRAWLKHMQESYRVLNVAKRPRRQQTPQISRQRSKLTHKYNRLWLDAHII